MSRENWNSAMEKYFGAKVSPCEHLVQIFEEDNVFLDTLEGFVRGGLEANEGIILIATPAHLSALERRLVAQGFDVEAARASDQYIALDAEETLARFMNRGWPDEVRFKQLVIELIERARGKYWRRVRAFGEMVAVLWANGHNGATIRLEHLWHQFCQTERFSLFCAYPKSGFTQNVAESIQQICATHSHTLIDSAVA